MRRSWGRDGIFQGIKNPPQGRVLLTELKLPASHFLQRLADVGQRADGFDAGRFEDSELLGSGAFAAGDDRTGVAHALAGRSRDTRDVGHDRFGHVGLDVGSGFVFSRTADLADHDDRFGLRIFLEQLQHVDEAGAGDRVAADAHAGGLAVTDFGGLLDGFVGQRARTGNDADAARLVDVARHDADLALARSDDAGAVRADQAHAQLVALHFHFQHVESRHAFGDADDQLDAGECGFEDRILAECRRHVDHGSIGAGGGNCVGNGVEHRQTEVFGAALARRYTADHFGAVCNRLLRVQGALRAGEALADYLGVLVDQY